MVWGCACGLDVLLNYLFFVYLFIYLFTFFPHCELSYFSPSIYKQWVPREHNSSYKFILMFLQLCTCFLHSLKMCMCFSYIPCRIFCHFFVLFELCHFYDLRCIDSGYLVIATFHTIFNRSFWNFAHVISRVCRSARGLDMIFNFIFVTFSTLTSLFSEPQILWKCTDCGYFLSPISHASYEKMHMLSMKFLYSYNPCL